MIVNYAFCYLALSVFLIFAKFLYFYILIFKHWSFGQLCAKKNFFLQIQFKV